MVRARFQLTLRRIKPLERRGNEQKPSEVLVASLESTLFTVCHHTHTHFRWWRIATKGWASHSNTATEWVLPGVPRRRADCSGKTRFNTVVSEQTGLSPSSFRERFLIALSSRTCEQGADGAVAHISYSAGLYGDGEFAGNQGNWECFLYHRCDGSLRPADMMWVARDRGCERHRLLR